MTTPAARPAKVKARRRVEAGLREVKLLDGAKLQMTTADANVVILWQMQKGTEDE